MLLVVLLLVLATAYSGAFSVRAWAPPALLVLGTLLAMQLAGGVLRLDSWPLRVMVGAIWGLAAWAALSMLWSPSPSAAWEGAGRTAFYAALVSVPPLMLIGSRALRAAGLAAVGGIAALALIMAVRLVLEGENVMLAGRLNEPVGYRNATACLFALGVWPLLSVAATRGLSRFARAMAFALAELCLGLAYLTQSRGIVLGLAAGGLVAIGLGPDRVRRAWLALALVAGLALASNWLLTPYDAFIAGTVGPDDVDTAATALVVLTLAAFAVGLAAALFDSGLRAGSSSALQLRRLARVGLVVVAIGAVGGGLAAAGNPIAYASDRWDEFRGNETTLTGSRLGNVSGQRYDLWRVALREFKDAPLIGVGEGGYPVGYYELRETDRNLSNPHSLLFGTLAELGIVGVALLLAFLIAAFAALAGRWRSVPVESQRIAGALLAGGIVAVAQLSVDWIWRVPGVTGLALFMLALGVTQIARAGRSGAESPRSPAGRAAGAVALAVPILAIGILYGSTFHIARARAEAGDSPQAQLDHARAAAGWNPFSVTSRYLQASALETLGRRDEARAQLLEALERESENFATMGLLGDLETRAGRLSEARRWYARALERNPLDVGLQRLAG